MRRGDDLVLSLELPGFEADDLRVELRGSILLISGTHEVEHAETGPTWRRTRIVEDFARSYALPPDVDADHIACQFEDGTLTVAVALTETATIPIASAEIKH
jgi:HSP20 family protein